MCQKYFTKCYKDILIIIYLLSMRQYCYITIEREFIKTNENIHKIGKTKQDHTKKMYSYPKDSILKIISEVCDADKCERDIIKEFDIHFLKRLDLGVEYYQGDDKKMCKLFTKITEKYKVLSDSDTDTDTDDFDETYNKNINEINKYNRNIYEKEQTCILLKKKINEMLQTINILENNNNKLSIDNTLLRNEINQSKCEYYKQQIKNKSDTL